MVVFLFSEWQNHFTWSDAGHSYTTEEEGMLNPAEPRRGYMYSTKRYVIKDLHFTHKVSFMHLV